MRRKKGRKQRRQTDRVRNQNARTQRLTPDPRRGKSRRRRKEKIEKAMPEEVGE